MHTPVLCTITIVSKRFINSHLSLDSYKVRLNIVVYAQVPFNYYPIFEERNPSPANLRTIHIVEELSNWCHLNVFYVCSQVPSNYYPIFEEGNPSPANLQTIHIVEELSNWRHLNVFYVCSQVSYNYTDIQNITILKTTTDTTHPNGGFFEP